MTKFKFLPKNKIAELPKAAGVYVFLARRSPRPAEAVGEAQIGEGGKNNREFLYIGKAANIRERVKNHLNQPSLKDNLYLDKTAKIGFIQTDSEIEAFLLEADLIKKYQPRYNVMWRDDKNYFYVGITKSELPRVFITHQTPKTRNSNIEIRNKSKVRNSKFQVVSNFGFRASDFTHIGPFVDGRALKQTLKYLRKVFPYYSARKHPEKLCSWCHLFLCPGPNPNRDNYKKNIKNLISVFKGQRKSVLKSLKIKMREAAIKKNFEAAAKTRDQIAYLEKVMLNGKIFSQPELAEIRKPWSSYYNFYRRIEGYDVSNIQGKFATGAMVTFINGRPDKNYYRKFKIKIESKPNDIAMLKEVLTRRFNHPEWPLPELVLIDGGKAQLNAASRVISNFKSLISKQIQNPNFKIQIIALTKDKRHRGHHIFSSNKKEPIKLSKISPDLRNLLLQINAEAHRFAIAYHRKLRKSGLLD